MKERKVTSLIVALLTALLMTIALSCGGEGGDDNSSGDNSGGGGGNPPPANHAPVAAMDAYSTPKNQTLTIASPGVLSNDTDQDGNAMTSVIVSYPASGSLNLNANGSFTFTPAHNFVGTVQFSYYATDGSANSNTVSVTITVTDTTPTNHPPVAQNDSYTTNEGVNLNVNAPGCLQNDTDQDADPLTAVLNTWPQHGNLTLNQNGSFSYAPNAGWFGNDSFTYHANDGTADSNIATVNITVNEVNRAPTANADTYSVNAGSTLTVNASMGVLSNDSDPDSDPITASILSGVSTGSLTFNPDGSFTYTPPISFSGNVTFTYRAYDGRLYSTQATVTITVNPGGSVNNPPSASPDTYSVNEDATLTVSVASGVLANDSDPDGNPITAILHNGTIHGTLALNANGSFTYTPNPGYSGPDSFTYRAYDGQAYSNTATVSITVNPVNYAPTASNDSYTMNENTTLTVAVPGVLGNDSDPDSDPLTALLHTGTTHGILNLNANGSFTYTPNAGYAGTDTFQYRAYDGSLYSGIATVTITVSNVNQAPVGTADSYTMNENATLTVAVASGVLVNDNDPDGDPLTALLHQAPTHGIINLANNGSFTYTPYANFAGTETFQYRAYDGSLYSAPVTVTITVNNVNSAPVGNVDNYIMNQNTTLTVAVANGVLVNDIDPDGDSLEAVLYSGTASGTLNLASNGSFTYTPTASFTGTITFVYRAFDGVLFSGQTTVTITVNSVNGAPTAGNDNYVANKNTTLTVTAANGVLANDTDPESNPLTAVVSTFPSHGTLTMASNGAFNYTPATDFTGIDSFTYRAFDGTNYSNTATVTLTVNAPPSVTITAPPNGYTTTAPAIITLVASAIDVDGIVDHVDFYRGTTLVGTSNGPTFAVNMSIGFIGDFEITAVATDNNGATGTSAPITIHIVNSNGAPVANNDSYSTPKNVTLNVPADGVLANDSDPNGNPITAVLNTSPGHGTLTLNANGSFTYVPFTGYVGTDSFTYHANDGSLNSNVVTVTITVTPTNTAPVAAADNYTMNENTTLTVALPGVLGNDSDVDSDPLEAVLHGTTNHGNLTLNSNGSFVYTPVANYVGTDTFTYRAFDGITYSAVTTVTITIVNVNNPPVAGNDAYSLVENTELIMPAPGVMLNDFDTDGDPLIVILHSGPSHGTLNLNNNGSFTYTPNTNYYGTDSFTYYVDDGTAYSNQATVTLTITPAPYIRIIANLENTATTLSVIGDCCRHVEPWGQIGIVSNNDYIDVACDLALEAIDNHQCDLNLNVIPPITNACGTTYWLPCQDGSGDLIDGLGGEGLDSLNISISPTGLTADETPIAWEAIDNGQQGGWYRALFDEINVLIGIKIDSDADGLLNPNDNCILVWNPDQLANPTNIIGPNGLRVGNACIGVDNDNDTWLNLEDSYPTDPWNH